MISSISLSSDISSIHMTGNKIGEFVVLLSGQRPSVIFEEVIVGPGVTNNKLSRNARITMTNNTFGRFRVSATLLALNFSCYR